MVPSLFLLLALCGLSQQTTIEVNQEAGNDVSSELSSAEESLNSAESADEPQKQLGFFWHHRHHHHCKCKSTGFKAAISAPCLQNLDFHERIVFDSVLTNSGNAYNPHTGVFTAPCNGMYVFTVDATACESHHVYLELVSDGNVVMKVHPDARDSKTDAASGTAVLVLNKGKQVWVRLGQGGCTVLHGNYATGFSGFKV